MPRKYKRHSSTFKSKVALEAIKEQSPLEELSHKHGIASGQISTWKKHLEDNAETLFATKQEKNQKEEIDKLHRIIGQLTAERDFLERALSR